MITANTEDNKKVSSSSSLISLVLHMASMEAAATVPLIVVVGLLGVTSAVLGFVAEAKKLTV